MLRSMNDLKNYGIRATDGDIGHVRDFYFDDVTWMVRYLIIETGIWLSGRKVLISPIAIGRPNWAEKVLPVSITKDQVRNGPDIDTEKPVSRQYEMGYLDYYGYVPYWEGISPWSGVGHLDVTIPGMGFEGGGSEQRSRSPAQTRAAGNAGGAGDPHLRSCKTVVGYHVQATDGDIGRVQGMLVDEETWGIQYLVVDAGNGWTGHQVLVAPGNILSVSWSGSTVSVNLTRQAVKDALPYDSAAPMNHAQEAVFDAQHDHTSTFV
jgi:hypothetical protein